MKKSGTIHEPELAMFSGSHRAMGRQQGSEYREMIEKGREVLRNSEELELMKPGFLPFEVFMLMAQAAVLLRVAPHFRKYYREQYRRLLGIARGAGVSPSYVLLLSSFEIEMNKIDLVRGGCTAAGVAASRSADGEPVIIKNFDYPENFSEFHALRHDAPEGRNRVLGVTSAPLPGCHEGVNEHGLCIAYNYGYGQDEPKYFAPISAAVQEALETCTTTREAVSLLQKCRHAGGALLMICDEDGDLCTVELSNLRAAERLPENGLIVNTNHYHAPRLREIDIPEDAVYSNSTIRVLRGLGCRESTEARYARVHELLDGIEKISEEDLVKVFSDHGSHGSPSDNTICRHSDYFCTTCSVILYPVRRSMKVMYSSPCAAEYREFSV